jgi:hypothetical protein
MCLIKEQRPMMIPESNTTKPAAAAFPFAGASELNSRLFYGQYAILCLYYFPALLVSIGYAIFSDEAIKFKTRSKADKLKIILCNLSIPFGAQQTNFILLGGYEITREERFFEGLHFVFLIRAIFQLLMYFVFLPISLIIYTSREAAMPWTLATILLYSGKTA